MCTVTGAEAELHPGGYEGAYRTMLDQIYDSNPASTPLEGASFELAPEVEQANTPDQLGQISTHWSVLRAAYGSDEKAKQAMTEVVMRYRRAILRYLHARLPSPDAVQDVFQEFMIQFIEKKIGTKKPRGPFRYYIKGILDNLVADYHRKRKRWFSRWRSPELLDTVGARDADLEDRFTREWKKQLLEAAWERFAEEERKRKVPIYFVALRLKHQYPRARSNELAERLSRYVGKEVNETYYRKLLERARAKLLMHIVEEVRQSLGVDSQEMIAEELRELGLYDYYERLCKGSQRRDGR